MFKRVIGHKGFWKSVAVLTVVYGAVLLLLQVFLYSWKVISPKLTTASFALTLCAAAFIAAFAIAYAKFWNKLKQQDYKNR